MYANSGLISLPSRIVKIEGHIDIHFYFWLRPSDGKGQKLCVVFEGDGWRHRMNRDVEAGRSCVSEDDLVSDAAGDRVKSPVLVPAIEFVEDPKRVGGRGFRIMKRLQPLDECLSVRIKRSDAAILSSLKGRPVDEDRELDPALIRRRILLRMEDGELKDGIVEGGAEIEEKIPENGAQLRRRFGTNVEMDAVLAGIRIELADGCVRIRLEEGLARQVQRMGVFYCPLKLRPGTFKPAHRLTSS
jgi:hypothetical protein